MAAATLTQQKPSVLAHIDLRIEMNGRSIHATPQFHHSLFVDQMRMRGCLQAIEQLFKPDDVVNLFTASL